MDFERIPSVLAAQIACDTLSGCWRWTGARNWKGYGVARWNKASRPAHRVVYELLVGPIPDGHLLDHLCFVRDCVNPNHLRPVTNKQNMEHRPGPNRNGKSGVRGVSWHKGDQRWHAHITHNGKRIHLGCFDELADADKAARAARERYFTHNDERKTA